MPTCVVGAEQDVEEVIGQRGVSWMVDIVKRVTLRRGTLAS